MLLICCDCLLSLCNNNSLGGIINLYIMAIVNSLGGGIARKSADNRTFRMVRGRIVVSRKRQKLTAGGSAGAITRGLGGNFRKPLFAMINLYMAEHASDIQVSFNRSRYGSQRNYFFTANYRGLSSALLPLATSASTNDELPSLAEIDEAISTYATANPESIYRVRLNGFPIVYLSGEWSSDDNPISGGATDGLGTGAVRTSADESVYYDAPAAFSLNFHAGAKIVRDAGTVHITGASIPSGITAGDITYLTKGGAPAEVAVTSVVSAAGTLEYGAPAITESQNILGVKVASVYVRLSSAYVKTSGSLDEDPLG